MEEQPIQYIDALLQYYLHIPNPGELSDSEWVTKFFILSDIRKKETK